MNNMDIKANLKSFINDCLGETASPVFLKRAFSIIDESPTDKENLTVATEKVSKMISLFIDKDIAKEVSRRLNDILRSF